MAEIDKIKERLHCFVVHKWPKVQAAVIPEALDDILALLTDHDRQAEQLAAKDGEIAELGKRRGGECQKCGTWVCPPLTCYSCLRSLDILDTGPRSKFFAQLRSWALKTDDEALRAMLFGMWEETEKNVSDFSAIISNLRSALAAADELAKWCNELANEKHGDFNMSQILATIRNYALPAYTATRMPEPAEAGRGDK